MRNVRVIQASETLRALSNSLGAGGTSASNSRGNASRGFCNRANNLVLAGMKLTQDTVGKRCSTVNGLRESAKGLRNSDRANPKQSGGIIRQLKAFYDLSDEASRLIMLPIYRQKQSIFSAAM